MTVADLEEYLSRFDGREEVMVRIRLPDIDFEVCDWAFAYPEGSDGPELETAVHGFDLDFPDVIRRLKALVDRAAYYNFVD
jgi:hypothetical protein